MKRLYVSWIAILTLLLVSCTPAQPIESTGIINALGIDFIENNKLLTTLVVFQFAEQSDEFTKIISGEAHTIQGAIENAEMASLYNLVPGKNKITVFGRDVADEGIFPSIDTLTRDPSVPDLMYLAVSDSTAQELFNIDQQETFTDIGQYLHSVIERHSVDHNIPRKTLQDFIRIYYDIGQDNVIPIFEIVEGIPRQNKNALFKNDRMIGELSRHETLLINLMDLTVKDYRMELTLPLEPFRAFIDEEGTNKNQQQDTFEISLTINKGKSKTRVTDVNTLTFETNTKLKLYLIEQNAGLKLQDPETHKILEKEITKKMISQFEALLKKTQDYTADPFGYGRYYRMTQKGKTLTNEEWYEKFPTIKVDFNIETKILRHGAID